MHRSIAPYRAREEPVGESSGAMRRGIAPYGLLHFGGGHVVVPCWVGRWSCVEAGGGCGLRWWAEAHPTALNADVRYRAKFEAFITRQRYISRQLAVVS
jgi:hypothetical protein